jgi:hypothetical protein
MESYRQGKNVLHEAIDLSLALNAAICTCTMVPGTGSELTTVQVYNTMGSESTLSITLDEKSWYKQQFIFYMRAVSILDVLPLVRPGSFTVN